jgi:hypothetical protein
MNRNTKLNKDEPIDSESANYEYKNKVKTKP